MLKTAIRRYFLTGLLVVVPIWGTILILKTLFTALDGILGDAMAELVPDHYIPGLGIVCLVLLIFLVGVFAANFIGRQIVGHWEDWLARLPLVRGIYSTLKSMMDILSFSERGSYRRVVLIQFPKNGHYCFAFVTGMTKGETTAVGEEALTHVYVPTSPNPTSGYFLLVPEREVTAVDISIEEAMKLIVSGGLYTPSGTIKSALNSDAKRSQIKQPDVGVPIG